jgi:hypothetical protein
VTRVRVPAGEDPHAVGQVLVGRAAPARGELVVGGYLLPEQRQSVQQAAALIELGRPPDDRAQAQLRIESRARVSSYSSRRRQEFVAQTSGLLDQLGAAVDGSGSGVVPAAVVDGALALGGGADVLVLAGLDHLPDPAERRRAEALAEELARHDAAVIVLTSEEEPSDA